MLILAACSSAEPADGGPGDAAPPDAGPPPPPANDLDLLFLIDTSASLSEEQAALGAALPRLFEILASGDIDGDGAADVRPFDTVQAGVINADMGTGGFNVPTCTNSMFGDDGVLQTAGSTALAGCEARYPPFLQWRADDPAEAIARPLACIGQGTSGCGFEQPLEAILKALSPARATPGTAAGYEPPRFFANAQGHGDDRHRGFARDDSLLAVVLFSDEDDCSAHDPELFNLASGVYQADLNQRCLAHANEALHPVSRYVDGLLQLRRSPDRLAFVPIVGIPRDLEGPADVPPSFPPLISPDPAVRDDRMVERIDPTNPVRLFPSCDEPGTGLAFPPVRIVRAASELDRRGARVSVASICTNDLSGAVDRLVYALRR